MAKIPTLPEKFFAPLRNFAEQLTSKFSAKSAGEPEDQLKPPVDQLFFSYSKILSQNIVLKGESTLHGRLGRPDFAIHRDHLPIGYVELKAPGKGTNPELFKGHDRDQWKRFQNVPNLIYTDGNEWALFRNGELVESRIRLAGDVRTDGKDAVTEKNAVELFQLLSKFITWAPVVPRKPKELAAYLAPFCRLIRQDVLDSLKDSCSPMKSLKAELKTLLFPDADDDQFADAHSQTVIFALLLGQMEGADVLDLGHTYATLEQHHSLLSRSLQFLTDKEVQKEIGASLSLTQRVIHEIPKGLLKSASDTKDPWLFFYEDFLASYDPKLRKEAGVYFTPLEVVRFQVRMIDEILHKHLGKQMGFVEPGVAVLDPAVGTGTYLLGIVDHALLRVEKEEGPGAVKGGARALVNNLHGFEWMVGPYSIAQLRFSQIISKHGVPLPSKGLGIYLTNTLESPHTVPPAPPLFHKPIAQEHERALKIKESEHILVCLGNPPYGRHEASAADNQATTGGWVRYGDPKYHTDPILKDFLEPASKAGHGVHLKNLYNLYVYFIRWSLWKVFEHKTAVGPGILSFITASSYLDGDAFAGVREHMRKICDYIDVIDLGGEGRGARKDENVFAIQTPVAIFIAWRKGKPDLKNPAKVRYTRMEGSREEKLRTLDSVTSVGKLKWETAPGDWQAPFKPAAIGEYTAWPNITDLFPWQNSGVKAGRTWVIGPSKENLIKRLTVLFDADKKNQVEWFKNSPTGRKFHEAANQLPPKQTRLPSLDKVHSKHSDLIYAAMFSKEIEIVRYAYRSFDRQYLIADARFLDRPGPSVWQAHSGRQIYLTGLLTKPVGVGSALIAASEIPDMDHFSGRGAKDIVPLYRDADCTQPNILPGLLELLGKKFGRTVSPEDFAGYVYGILAHPEYTRQFADDLTHGEVRVPLTKNKNLFGKVSMFGGELIWLHTYGERLHNADRPVGRIPKGKARCAKAISDQESKYPNGFRYEEDNQRLCVGDGAFAPVSPEIWEFEVSGLKVVQSWLGYRMKDRKGRKSSPLDDIRPATWTYEFTRELLELLWVLEKTVEGYPEQKRLFENVLDGELFAASELPEVPDGSRKAPKTKTRRAHQDQMGFDLDEDE